MVCLVEYLYWKSTGKEYKCEGEQCRFYGCDTCHEDCHEEEEQHETNCGTDMRETP